MMPEIVQQPLASAIQKRFWDHLPEKNLQKFLFLKSNSLVDAMIAQGSLKKEFFKKFEHTTPPTSTR